MGARCLAVYETMGRAKRHSQVTSADAVHKGVERVVKDFGQIDVFVANAGKHCQTVDGTNRPRCSEA